MKLSLLQTFDSNLPEHDDHPYRSGVWQPQRKEYDAWDMDVVGEIPDDLSGVYIRNTENPLFEPIQRYHPFDGDGMLHAISFDNGEARYSNRFVRTEGFLAEQESQESLWAGITEHPSVAIAKKGWGARSMMKDNGSTDVIVHGGVALASFYQCGELYQLDPITMETLGVSSWNGQFPAEGVSAHTKLDEHTGEMLFFNYSTEAPYMHYGLVSREGELTNYVDIPLPGPRLPHDMAFTENYAILNDFPLFWDPKSLAEGHYSNNYRPDLPSRFAVIPRNGATQDIKWFEADPTFVLHWTNAYEDGDEIILDGFFQHNPTGLKRADAPERSNRKGLGRLGINANETMAHRWIFNMKTGECREQPMSDSIVEFPMINGRHAGRRHRYSYNARGIDGLFAFDGLVKHDLDTGVEQLVEFPPGTYVSETVMAPRVGSTAEDDGYLLTYTSDTINNLSECWILDAANPTTEPVAKIRLPEKISSGTHATWAPRSDLR